MRGVDDHGPARVPVAVQAGELERELALARARRAADDRDRSVVHQFGQLGQFGLAADEREPARGHVAVEALGRRRLWSGPRRQRLEADGAVVGDRDEPIREERRDGLDRAAVHLRSSTGSSPAGSHSRTMPSAQPDTKRPSGAFASQKTAAGCRGPARRSPLTSSHTTTEPSTAPEHMRLPSAATASAWTRPACATVCCTCAPVARSQVVTEPSAQPASRRSVPGTTASASAGSGGASEAVTRPVESSKTEMLEYGFLRPPPRPSRRAGRTARPRRSASGRAGRDARWRAPRRRSSRRFRRRRGDARPRGRRSPGRHPRDR